MKTSIHKSGNFRSYIFLLLVLCFGIAVMITAYSLSFGATSLVDEVSKVTAKNDTVDKFYNGIFRIQEVKYYDRALAEASLNKTKNFNATNASLCENNTEYLIAELVLNNKKMPSKCTAFIDNQLVREIRTNELFEVQNSYNNESLMPVNLGQMDMHTPHKIRICCDNFCEEKKIKSIC